MVSHTNNHNHKHENDASGPAGLWAGVMAGLLIGGLAGALTMLLLAPQSGKKTRAKLQRQSHELREKASASVEDAVAQVRVKAGQITQDVREQAEELEQRGQVILEGQKEKGR